MRTQHSATADVDLAAGVAALELQVESPQVENYILII